MTHKDELILSVFLPGKLTNPLNGSHRHWSVRARWAKDWRAKTYLLAKEKLKSGALDPRDSKDIRFVAWVWNLMDEDGLQASLKPVRDGLRDAGIIHDDGPKSGHRFFYNQSISRQERGVWILVD